MRLSRPESARGSDVILLFIGHRKFCVPPAVICEHRLRASCEPEKVFCGHLRASASICVLAEMLYFLLACIWVHAQCVKN
jgi:hypothetical protein